LIDLTYVENCVDAIELSLLRCDDLSGSVFNISNGEPSSIRAVCDTFYRALGWQVSYRNFPYALAMTQATVVEAVWKLMFPGKQAPISRYAVGLAAYSQTLCIDRAREELGYRPKLSLTEGLQRSAEWFKQSA
jgi:nucleoside-diphosphate-sugar epimerase